MSAPNRASEVGIIVNAHSALLHRGKNDKGEIVDGAAYDAGRLELTARICHELNRDDGGNWGLLKKTDQRDKIPCDVMVWRPTMEGFDVLAGNPDRASWQGPNTGGPLAWIWCSADEVVKPDKPTPDKPGGEPTGEPPDDDVRVFLAIALQLVEGMAALKKELEEVNVAIAKVAQSGVRVHF